MLEAAYDRANVGSRGEIFTIITTVETNGSFRVGDSRILVAAGLMVVVVILIVCIVGGDHVFTCGLRRV